MSHIVLPDSRPYPTDPVKNELLIYAGQIAHSNSIAQTKLARESLNAKIHEMMAQNFYLSLSVAMSMAPDAESYRALMDALDDVLQAKNENEVQWFALPVIVVSGAKQASQLKSETPEARLKACLENHPTFRNLSQATWLPQLLCAEDFARIKADKWYAAKQSPEAAAEFAASLPHRQLAIPKDQSVHTLYALGYGDARLIASLGQNLQEVALPLMQVWQEHLTENGLTLFTNPLPPQTPTSALAEASHLRLRMALDVFSANAIRAVRLQSPRVGVVMAAEEGGKLLFGFNATDQAFALQQQVFVWPLSPRDNIGVIQQNFLDLMVDCHVEHIRLLHDILPESAEMPDYSQAQNFTGHNPLFSHHEETH